MKRRLLVWSLHRNAYTEIPWARMLPSNFHNSMAYCLITIVIVVEVGHFMFLEPQENREAAYCLWNAVDAVSVGRPYQFGVEHF